ncbi:hypothetical protein [Pseudomonas viridiflava]|uniref:MmyB family transcriptional regulator n=2 Tax=Pseudomonas viridiflava TaxID=33069 RepID=UPI0013CE5F07
MRNECAVMSQRGRQGLKRLSDRPMLVDRREHLKIVSQPLQRMLKSLTGQPAYVIGRRWDILAWNRAAEVVYGDYARLEGDERNVLHLVFADAAHYG